MSTRKSGVDRDSEIGQEVVRISELLEKLNTEMDRLCSQIDREAPTQQSIRELGLVCARTGKALQDVAHILIDAADSYPE